MKSTSEGSVQHKQEELPFTVSTVDDGDALAAAIRIRQSAYARHLPGVAQALHEPEKWDFRPGTVNIVALSKLDGAALGSMRIHTNEFAALPLEQSVTLPDEMRACKLAEATRLGVAGTKEGRVVKTALFKAFYLYCLGIGVDYMTITARRPLDRMYEALLFSDVDPTAGYIPMKHVGGLPHRVLSFDVRTARQRWHAAKHPLLNFVCDTHHKDIHFAPAPLYEPPAHCRAAETGMESVALG